MNASHALINVLLLAAATAWWATMLVASAWLIGLRKRRRRQPVVIDQQGLPWRVPESVLVSDGTIVELTQQRDGGWRLITYTWDDGGWRRRVQRLPSEADGWAAIQRVFGSGR